MKNIIYLDYSATTPVDKKVLKEMAPFFIDNYGNPSSIHRLGQESLFAVDESRQKIAQFLGCKSEEIFFTGSATESNNLAISGLVKKIKKERKKIHIVTSEIEHDAVLGPIEKIEKEGYSVTRLRVGKEGIISIKDFQKEITEDTALVSIMYANNEIGTIQPIRKIGEVIKKENEKRGQKNKIFFHTDAVQAMNYLDCDVNHLKVDMLSFSGHKIYGPKGIGVLYAKRGVALEPIVYGGGQEKGLRSGTENIPGIAGMGKAVELLEEVKKDNERIRKMRDRLIEKVLKNIKNTRVNGSLENRLPNNANFSFKGAEGESVVMALDQKRICVSTGSACSSKSLEPSHVLMATGISREEAHCSLRVTLGKETKEREIDELIKVLPDVVERLRKISGR